jgi:hypothetical protein
MAHATLKPGDVVVELCPSNGAPCYYGRPAGDPGKPEYGNLITGLYDDGFTHMCASSEAHPVQAPEDIARMQAGAGLGFHCEVNPSPPPPPAPPPWKAIGFSSLGVAVLLAVVFAPRIWRMLKPMLRFGG